jgi:signal peptidase I
VTSEDRDSVSADETDGTGSRSSRSSRPDGKKRKKHLPIWQETILLLGIALVLAIVIKALFIQAFYIPSESMEPGLVNNDRILVEKVSYWFGGTPQRGDVVVFQDPGDWLSAEEKAGPQSGIASLMARIGLYPTGGHLVKRVIGVAGDVIKCCDHKGRIMVNGHPLNEQSYVKEKGLACNGPMVNDCKGSWTAGPVPPGHIFVMGDNRGHSADSSYHMCKPHLETDCVPGDEYVSTDLVVGKVFVVLWPSDHFRWVQRPATFAGVPDRSPS